MSKKNLERRYGYFNEYNSEHYERIVINVPKGKKTEYQEFASNHGLSLSSYVQFLIKREIGREQNKNKQDN